MKSMEAIPQIPQIQRCDECHQIYHPKNNGHFERRAAIGRKNTPRHSMSLYHAHSKQVSAGVSNIVLNALIFGNISSFCAKEYLIAAILMSS